MGIELLTSVSFERLHRECAHKLTAVAFGYVRDRDTARDIVSDSFATLWERRDSVEFTNIEAYLFRIVRNNCLLHRRSEQIGRSVHENIRRKERGVMEFYTRSIECCDPNELFRSEIVEIYRAELARMPELTRRIINAHKVEGKSYREIAEELGVGTKKIDKELQKAAVQFRESLKDYLPALSLFLF